MLPQMMLRSTGRSRNHVRLEVNWSPCQFGIIWSQYIALTNIFFHQESFDSNSFSSGFLPVYSSVSL